MARVARTVSFLFLAVLSLSCSADQPAAPTPAFTLVKNDNDGDPDCRLSRKSKKKNPVDFLCTIQIPGEPLTSSQKGWVEQQNGMYYLSDASNFGVDIFKIRTHEFEGRITGFVGNMPVAGGTATTNGAGPNAFVSAPDRAGGRDKDWDWDEHDNSNRLLWVSDGNSTVRVVDMDRRKIIASISTAIAACDGGTATTHYCGRSNEIGYDPLNHIILVSNPSALDVTTHLPIGGYATFISAKRPYKVLGHIIFPGAGNVEGHVWVPELKRFLLPIQPTTVTQPIRDSMYIAVINPRTMKIESKRTYFCPEIPGTVPTSTGNNNLQLGPGRNLWGQICGRPIRMDVRTGAILNVVTQVGTGDQDWYNPGDGNFYVHGQELRPAAPGVVPGTASLGVMNAKTGEWEQNVPNLQGASPSAYARTNEIFTRVVVTAAMVANPALDLSRCEVKGRGCVVVFAHVGKDDEEENEPE